MNDGACRPHLLTRLAIENWRERRRTTRSLPRASPELKAQTAFATRTERMNEAIFPAPIGRAVVTLGEIEQSLGQLSSSAVSSGSIAARSSSTSMP